jgi:heme ABC exporter ATP-binding subunit CcmA
MSLAVHLRNAVCLLGRFPALAGVDLDASPGEVVLLTGPNGAGKTTILRACAGLVPFAGGTAVVLDHDLRLDRRAVRRDVGLLGHTAGLYDDLSVLDNVRFSVRAGGADPNAVGAALDRLGLAGRLRDVPAARLSAGQRRRTALAALYARRPRLWLLDEPHAGLDAGGRDLLDTLVAEAVAGGATVLLASHDLDRAGTLAGRVVTVAGGVAHGAKGRGHQAAERSGPEAAEAASPAAGPPDAGPGSSPGGPSRAHLPSPAGRAAESAHVA